MGNVQSEAPADAALAPGRGGGGKPSAADGCSADAPRKTVMLLPQPGAPAAKEPCPAPGSKPDGHGGQVLPSELGKCCSRTAKLMLPSVWGQTPSSPRRHSEPAQELGPGEASKGTEPSPVQGDPQVPAGPQHMPPKQDELKPRKAAPKGKTKGEPVSVLRPGGQGDLPGKGVAAPVPLERAQGTGTPKGPAEPQGCSPQPPTRARSPAPADTPHAKDQGGPRAAAESPARAAPSWTPPASGGKKPPPSHEEGSRGDAKAPASPRPAPSAQAQSQASRAREPPGGLEGGVNPEGVQALLEHGLSFLYKVTIQPGQCPPSIKAIKHRASLISSGISYADALKQSPQPAPGGAPGPPPAAENLPLLRELDRREQEELDSFTQAFLEQFQKMGTKEPAPPAPQPSSQAKQQLHLVKILDDLTSFSLRGPEGPKPRVPTPYPQRHKGQGRGGLRLGSDTAPLGGHLQPHRPWLAKDARKSPGPNREPLGESLQPSLASLVELEQRPQARQSQQRQGPEANPLARAALLPTPGASALPAGQPSPGKDQAMALPGQEALPPSPVPTCPEAPCPGAARPHTAPAQGCTHTKPKARKPAAAKQQSRAMGQPKAAASPKPQEKIKAHGQQKAKALKGRPPRQGRDAPQPPLAPAEACELGADGSPHQPQASARHWPPFQLTESCPRKCYCRHQEQRQLPRNISTWLTPSTNHLAEPPWVSTAILAGSLVAGTRFFLESYEQQAGDND